MSLSAGVLFNLRNRIAIVTGGGTGIGLMAARAMASNGATVYITGRRKDVINHSADIYSNEEGIKNAKGKLIPIQMNVTNKEKITEVVRSISRETSHIDILINNAGTGGRSLPARPEDGPEEYGAALFNEDLEAGWTNTNLINTTSAYYTTAAFLPLLSSAKSKTNRPPGSVIHIASISGMTKWSQNGQYAYNCSKTAMISLMRMQAFEFHKAEIDVRVNAISPGYFATEMTTSSSGDDNKSSWPLEEYQARMNRIGCMSDRPGTEEEMAQVILSLACNNYIRGQNIAIDGGLLLNHG